ncbi:hypothetical protein BAUCODRAFT_317733 [Baudoinia panamericana UAMH 10762]|uniref:Mid2 domain-containing protein n=1 Tax=Baudoinia panamericana (strain UAMH 10762) TaxID=717646 RepID=M2MY35_BAUPA|nr:uncharacterized protein BAUCODRAFT_317733 [Baudoinia panamericana UAMH 10762]EMC91190.1 hypothetical protein BAUCODRAFT_317733 [Baudoinia panamericana UAMH 10762]
MGADARVALYAPEALAPYVSLPSTLYGQTSYYSGTTINGTSTWVVTAIANCMSPDSAYRSTILTDHASADTPATISELTTYQDGPSSVVQVVPGLTPAPSTVAAAAATSASAGSGAALTTASPTSSAVASNNSGLSKDAQIGIGVGVGGGVVLIAIVALCAFCWGRRQRRRNTQYGKQAPAQASAFHLGSPPMQASSPYYVGGDGTQGWPNTYPTMQPMQPSPVHSPGQASPYQDPQYAFAGTHSPPPAELMMQKAQPTELPAEQGPHEVDSVAINSPPTPSPHYADVMSRKL